MTGRRAASPSRIGGVCAAIVLCLPACADLWGFTDLANAPDAGQLQGANADAAAGGDATGIGAGGSGGAIGLGDAGSGGVSGTFGVLGDAGTAGGADGGSGIGGSGTAGAVGTGGSAAGTGGISGTGGATGCIAGTNRCLGGAVQTCTTDGIWQSTGTATHELLTNPGFETGQTGWVVSEARGLPIVHAAPGPGGNAPQIAAQSPPNIAWLSGYNLANDLLSQQVAVPAAAVSTTVSFYYAIFTSDNGSAANDVLTVQVMDGAQTIPVAHFTDNTPVSVWTRVSTLLPTSVAGHSVTLRFQATSNSSAITSFYVDTVSVSVVACP